MFCFSILPLVVMCLLLVLFGSFFYKYVLEINVLFKYEVLIM